ncbi:MAG TPA: S4 domain-containing protein [Bacteroidales bacterium]|nr:S4 domain-containing protein [Bacteroidales bacterium]HRZ22287.1 S4 domain-containing protein [Bacteroidales bacterium]
MEEHIRIDKWLWAVRLFKTRNQASQACRAGKVRMDEQPVKPSREVHVMDVISVNMGFICRTVRVRALLTNRVSARLVPDYATDLTPEEEYARLKLIRETNYEMRDRGLGRPTKKQRRDIVRLKRYKI